MGEGREERGRRAEEKVQPRKWWERRGWESHHIDGWGRVVGGGGEVEGEWVGERRWASGGWSEYMVIGLACFTCDERRDREGK